MLFLPEHYELGSQFHHHKETNYLLLSRMQCLHKDTQRLCVTSTIVTYNYKHTMASIECSTMVDYSIQLVWSAVVFTDMIL